MKPETQAAIDRIMNRVPMGISEGHAAGLREILEYELREQDKRTRHACAEAITVSQHERPYPSPSVAYERARQICLNTQAI